ncbi:hypothetical protein VTL71DRAFT_1643 [Oculimacula yallundae]|uniref:Uncharacterized protein n=1 Tax=Oculimacula yallundae TaxID=86028 RepID=A0ABR4CDE4_9HELO
MSATTVRHSPFSIFRTRYTKRSPECLALIYITNIIYFTYLHTHASLLISPDPMQEKERKHNYCTVLNMLRNDRKEYSFDAVRGATL